MIRDVEIKVLNPDLPFWKEFSRIPEYGTEDSAGVDLLACIPEHIEVGPLKTYLVPTGISINMQTMPDKCVAMIFPRSGKGHKEGIVLGNSVGIIDQDYQGELKISILNRNPERYILIKPGDKIAQLVFLPIIRAKFCEVKEFSSTTERGAGGFGSTGG